MPRAMRKPTDRPVTKRISKDRKQAKQIVHVTLRGVHPGWTGKIDVRLRDLFPSERRMKAFQDALIDNARKEGLEIARRKVPSHGTATVHDVAEALAGELAGGSGKPPPI